MFKGTLERGTILIVFKNTFKNRLKNIFKSVTILGVMFSTTVLHANTYESIKYDGTKYDPKQIDCMSKAAYFESRGQSEKGQLAVIFTVLNRVKDSRFGNTPCKVVYSPNQFSWTRSKHVVKDKDSYARAKELVLETLRGEHRDITRGATHFHAKYVSPSWAKRMDCTIIVGDHKFYRSRIK